MQHAHTQRQPVSWGLWYNCHSRFLECIIYKCPQNVQVIMKIGQKWGKVKVACSWKRVVKLDALNLINLPEEVTLILNWVGVGQFSGGIIQLIVCWQGSYGTFMGVKTGVAISHCIKGWEISCCKPVSKDHDRLKILLEESNLTYECWVCHQQSVNLQVGWRGLEERG